MSETLNRDISRRALLTGAVRSTTDKQSFEAEAPAIIEISGACLVHSGVTCMTCRDACPEDAIRFKPRIGKPFLPEIQDDSCTRCQECIAACPVEAISLERMAVEAANE